MIRQGEVTYGEWGEFWRNVLAQPEYARLILANYEKEVGTVRLQATPFLSSSEAANMADASLPGRQAATCRSHLGALLFLSRGTRPDLSYAVGSLSRRVSNWTVAEDKRLARIFGYLRQAPDLGLKYTFRRGASAERVRIVAHSDSDHAGDIDSRRSTSGGAVAIETPDKVGDGGVHALVDW